MKIAPLPTILLALSLLAGGFIVFNFDPCISVVQAVGLIADELKAEYMAEGGRMVCSRSDQRFWDQARIIYDNLREQYESRQTDDDAREDYLCSFE